MHLFLALLVWLLRAGLVTRGCLVLENLALRQQLATYARRHKPPRLKGALGQDILDILVRYTDALEITEEIG